MILRFPHGLGDCTNFILLLKLYKKYGYNYDIYTLENKVDIFSSCGINATHIQPAQFETHSWKEADTISNGTNYWDYHKVIRNLNCYPLPNLGDPKILWQELLDIKITPQIDSTSFEELYNYLKELPRPLVGLHSHGNSYSESKNMNSEELPSFYAGFLDNNPGTLLLLDWDNRVSSYKNWRVRNINKDFRYLHLKDLLALMPQLDFLIGVDSGPLNLARLFNIPSVGIWPSEHIYPAKFSLPRDNQINITPESMRSLNTKTRLIFNIVEAYKNKSLEQSALDFALNWLDNPAKTARDLQIEQFLSWQRSNRGALSDYVDRNLGFKKVFDYARQFVSPHIIETGCARSSEDWAGAGYSTYLLGLFASQVNGHLDSVDITKTNCTFASNLTQELKSVAVHCEDSVEFLKKVQKPIDVLLLDSMDTEHPNHAEHALNEFKAALPNLHNKSIVIYDDTVYFEGKWHGKGSTAVPYMLERGWQIFHSGYQTILIKKV